MAEQSRRKHETPLPLQTRNAFKLNQIQSIHDIAHTAESFNAGRGSSQRRAYPVVTRV
jgi:hypothetical protein